MERTNEILNLNHYNRLYNTNNSKIFIEYIKKYGIDIINYDNILELYSRPVDSLSRLIGKNKSFLLSEKVTKQELDKYEIDGAYGSLTMRGITTPRCMINDKIFLINGKNYKIKGGYNHKGINYFDLIISNGVPEDLKGIIKFNNIDTCIGICTDKNDKNLTEQIERLKYLREKLMMETTYKYTIVEDEISTSNKKLCLLLKK